MASNSYLSKEVTEINICIVFTQNAINLTCLEQLKLFLLTWAFKRLKILGYFIGSK